MSDTPTAIDIGQILEACSLGEKACREAREAVCVHHQVLNTIEASKHQLAVAGAGVLGQIMNGQARVVQPGHPDDPNVKQAQQLQAIIVGNLGNVIMIAEALKPIHAALAGGARGRA